MATEGTTAGAVNAVQCVLVGDGATGKTNLLISYTKTKPQTVFILCKYQDFKAKNMKMFFMK